MKRGSKALTSPLSRLLFKKKLAGRFFSEAILPAKVLGLIDLEHLDIRNRSYVDEQLRDRHSDIVYRTKMGNADAFLYLLFEHQSAPDRFFVFRLLCYMVNLWREYIDKNPKSQTLPVILPMLPYHGKSSWNVPEQLWKLVDCGDAFREYVPDFSFELYNLADFEDESLLLGDFMAHGVVLG